MANQYGPTGQYPGGPSGHPKDLPGSQESGSKAKWLWIGGGIVVAIIAGIVLDVTVGNPKLTASETTSTTRGSVATLTPEEVEAARQRGAASAAPTSTTTRGSVATLTPEEVEAARQRGAESAARQEAARAAAEAAEAARFDPNTYEHVTDRELALIARDPDANRGRKIVIYGDVTQADAATGKFQILVNAAGSQYWNWYDFDENAMISVTNSHLFSNVVKDDLVQLYVEVKGSRSYSTTLGGSTTVPEFTALIVNVYGSN